MTARSPLLLLLAGALCLVGCGPDEISEAEPEDSVEAEDGGGGLVLGSAADLVVISDDHDDQLASLLDGGSKDGGSGGGGTRTGSTAARGGRSSGGGGGDSGATDRGRSASTGPALPSLGDLGMGQTGGRTISADQIQDTIQQSSGQIRACYERELKSSPSLSGKVVLSWTIGADGRVRSPRAARNTTGNRELPSCLKRAVRGWSFPRAESPQDVEYPFVFKPREFR